MKKEELCNSEFACTIKSCSVNRSKTTCLTSNVKNSAPCRSGYEKRLVLTHLVAAHAVALFEITSL